ncbi:MAG: glycosyltransferase [Actinobacteria bacterium]|nr:glycosyltransferase [Actinomycetota bacterium]
MNRLQLHGPRIDLVSEHASPLATLGGVDAGGQNVHVAALARGLATLGARVVVHTRRDDPSLPDDVRFGPGVVVHHIDAGPPGPLPKDDLLPHMGEFAERLAEAWEADRPDVVHSHFWMSGLAALDAGRRMGIPVVHTYHALGSVKRRHHGAADTSPPDRLAIEARLAREVDLVIATTGDEACELEWMGGCPSRTTVIPCGVDLHRFNPVGPVARRTGRFRVVVVSRLVERKGVGNVIRAVADVPGAELVVAGGPPEALLDEDSEARRFLAAAERLGVADRVRLLGGVDHDAVAALIRSADVVACCPWYEPFGLVAVEAMACGRPVVASATGGLAETVVPGVTGLLVPPRDPDAIAAALRRLRARPALARRMAESGAQRAGRYGWERIASDTMAAYASVRLRASGPHGEAAVGRLAARVVRP